MTSDDCSLLQRARMALMYAQLSSCTCLVKTPEHVHHDQLCRYRQIGSAIESICTVLKNNRDQK